MTRTTDIVYVTVMSNGHCRIAKDEGREAVSYTHLTLPTIYSV